MDVLQTKLPYLNRSKDVLGRHTNEHCILIIQVLKLNVVTTFLKRVGLTLNEKDVLRTWYLTFIMLRIGTFSDRLDVLRTV